MSAVAETEVSTISITGHGSDEAQAASMADVTAEELVAEIGRRDQATFDAEISRLTVQVDAAQRRLGAKMSEDGPGHATAEAEVGSAQRTLEQYQSAAPEVAAADAGESDCHGGEHRRGPRTELKARPGGAARRLRPDGRHRGGAGARTARHPYPVEGAGPRGPSARRWWPRCPTSPSPPRVSC